MASRALQEFGHPLSGSPPPLRAAGLCFSLTGLWACSKHGKFIPTLGLWYSPSPSLACFSPDLHRPQLKCHLQGEAVLPTCHPVLLSSQHLSFTDIFDIFVYPLSICHPLALLPETLPHWLNSGPPAPQQGLCMVGANHVFVK